MITQMDSATADAKNIFDLSQRFILVEDGILYSYIIFESKFGLCLSSSLIILPAEIPA